MARNPVSADKFSFLTGGFVANGPEPTGVVQASRARLLDFGVGDGVIVRSVPKAVEKHHNPHRRIHREYRTDTYIPRCRSTHKRAYT